MALFEGTEMNKAANVGLPMEIKVGVPHIKGLIKKVRASSYTKTNAVLDIIDNISFTSVGRINVTCTGDDITAITIIDNDPEGFINIMESGEKNPLNLAHINPDRHSNNDYMSEFGCGLKEAGIYLGNTLQIFTSISKNGNRIYIKATLNFGVMENCPCPIRSYQPEIETISFDEYKSNNPYYDVGSVVKIIGIGTDTDALKVDHLKNEIVLTYSKQFPDKKLYFNDEPLIEMFDIYTSEICKERKKETKIYFNIETQDLVFKINGCEDPVFTNSSNTKFNKTTKLSYNLKDTKWLQLVLVSTSIYGTKFDPNPKDDVFENKTDDSTYFENNLPKSNLYIYRNNRRHDKIDGLIKDSGDGWLNHIYHELYYTSKKINKYLGINSTKGKPTKRDNNLMNYIHLCLKEHNTLLNKKNFKTERIPDDESTVDDEEVIHLDENTVDQVVINPDGEHIDNSAVENILHDETTVDQVVINPDGEHIDNSAVENILQDETKVDEDVNKPDDEGVKQAETENYEKKTITVHEHIKGKIPTKEYSEMIEFLKINETSILNHKYGLEMFNIYLKLKTELIL